MMNCGDLTAAPTDISATACVFTAPGLASAVKAGGRRTQKDVGIMMTAAIAAMISSVVRQS